MGMVSVITITHPFPSIFDERRFKILDDAHTPQVGVRSIARLIRFVNVSVWMIHMQVGVGLIGYDCLLSSRFLSLIIVFWIFETREMSWTTRVVLLIRIPYATPS